MDDCQIIARSRHPFYSGWNGLIFFYPLFKKTELIWQFRESSFFMTTSPFGFGGLGENPE